MLRVFDRLGAHVGLLARGQDGLETARHDVEAEGVNTIVLPTDVVEPQWCVRRPALTPDANDCRRMVPLRGLGASPTTRRLARVESETRAVRKDCGKNQSRCPVGASNAGRSAKIAGKARAVAGSRGRSVAVVYSRNRFLRRILPRQAVPSC